MSDRLNDAVGRLAAWPIDHPLDGLEVEIARSLLVRRREGRTAAMLAPVQLASLCLALAIGVTAGGAAVTASITTPRAPGGYAAGALLAPSTLLEGER